MSDAVFGFTIICLEVVIFGVSLMKRGCIERLVMSQDETSKSPLHLCFGKSHEGQIAR